MGAVCGPGGCACCRCGNHNAPLPVYPVGYGLGCCGFPGGCCGYGLGLGPGGPFSCGGDCCGTSGIIFGNSDYFDYFCCGCCGITQNKCCGCGSGVGQSRCGGNGYCGGGCCCCCYEDYPMRRSTTGSVGAPQYIPQMNSMPTLTSLPLNQPPPLIRPISPPFVVPQRLSTPSFPIQSHPPQSIMLPNTIRSIPYSNTISPVAQHYPITINNNQNPNTISQNNPQLLQNQPNQSNQPPSSIYNYSNNNGINKYNSPNSF